MELSARDVHKKQFHDQWRGYNQEEVDNFLDRVAETLERAHRENTALRSRVGELEHQAATAREAEEMLKKTLITAQQAAEEAIAKAKTKASRLVAEGEERARRGHEEARGRMAAAESEFRRRNAEVERDFTTRRRALDEAIERLRAFEADLKRRLGAFLEQQLRALEALPDNDPPQPRVPPRPSFPRTPRPEAPEPLRSNGPVAGQQPGPFEEPNVEVEHWLAGRRWFGAKDEP